MVSWDDIQPFLAKLNKGTSTNEFKFSLPTEAQWEFSCRAGTSSMWNSGDDAAALPEQDWFGENSGERTHQVGQLRPNAFGLHDLLGNVSEWCADWYHKNFYAGSPVDDPMHVNQQRYLVQRGGSFATEAHLLRSAKRNIGWPNLGFKHLGFRLAMTIDTAKLKTAQTPPTDPDREESKYRNGDQKQSPKDLQRH